MGLPHSIEAFIDEYGHCVARRRQGSPIFPPLRPHWAVWKSGSFTTRGVGERSWEYGPCVSTKFDYFGAVLGAFCQRVFLRLVERVVLFVLRLKCLVKRKEALRGRNLSRDSQAEGAPMVHPSLWMCMSRQRPFSAHPLDTRAMPPKIHRRSRDQASNVACSSLHRLDTVIARLSLVRRRNRVCPSSVAEAVRRGGWIHLFAVTGRGGRNAAACLPG